MDELVDKLSHLAEHAYNRDMSSTNANIRVLPPPPVSSVSSTKLKMALAGDDPRSAILEEAKNAKPRFPPLEFLPCANVDAERARVCQKRGAMACGACKLVSYCSKVGFPSFILRSIVILPA